MLCHGELNVAKSNLQDASLLLSASRTSIVLKPCQLNLKASSFSLAEHMKPSPGGLADQPH